MALKPTYQIYHDLGAELAKHLDPVRTCEEVGALVGLTKKQVLHESYTALGKLAMGLKKTLPKDELNDGLPDLRRRRW